MKNKKAILSAKKEEYRLLQLKLHAIFKMISYFLLQSKVKTLI